MSISIIFINQRRFALDGKTYSCRKIAFDSSGFWVDDLLTDVSNNISRLGGFTIDASHVEQIDANDANLHFKKNIQHLYLDHNCNVSIAGDVSVLNTKGGSVQCASAASIVTKFANVVNPCSAFELVYKPSHFQRKSKHQFSFEGDVGKVFISNCNMAVCGSVMSIVGKFPSISLSIIGLVSLLEMNDDDKYKEDSTPMGIVIVNKVDSVKSTFGHISLRSAREALVSYGRKCIQNEFGQQRDLGSPLDQPRAADAALPGVHALPAHPALPDVHAHPAYPALPGVHALPAHPALPDVHLLPAATNSTVNSSHDESDDDYVDDDVDDDDVDGVLNQNRSQGVDNLKCDDLFGEATHEVLLQRKVAKALFGPLHRPLDQHVDVTHQIGNCVELYSNGQLGNFFGRPFPSEYCHLQVWYK
jgi:hypothetical protein